MDKRTQRFFLTLNIVILLVNLFIVGWQLAAKKELAKSYTALEKTFSSLRDHHGAMSSVHPEGLSQEEVVERTRFCSLDSEAMALEIDPSTRQAKYWPDYDHEKTNSNKFQSYSYSVSDGVVILENSSNSVPFRIFKIIEMIREESKNVIDGVYGGVDMYTDWCGD